MACRFQCSNCMDVLSVAERFAGRKILCPLCEYRLTVPAPGEAAPVLEQDFAAALKKFKLSSWDRNCAEQALALNAVDASGLRDAILEVRRARRKNEKLSLLDALGRAGKLEKSMALALAELARKGEGAAQGKLIECPNCFGSIPESSRECPLCGEALGDLVVHDMCPNCKREQPTGKTHCRTCGADMATGLRPGVDTPRCLRCQAALPSKARRCTRCKADLATYREPAPAVEALRAGRAWLSTHAFTIAVAVLVLFCVYASRNWADLRQRVTGIVESPERAALYEQVRRLDRALRYDDLDGIAELIDPGLAHDVTEATRTCILGGSQLGAEVESVDTLEHVSYDVDERAGRATVHTAAHGTFDVRTLKLPDIDPGEMTNAADAMQKVSAKGVRILSAKIPWKWVRRDGVWYYAGPLPD